MSNETPVTRRSIWPWLLAFGQVVLLLVIICSHETLRQRPSPDGQPFRPLEWLVEWLRPANLINLALVGVAIWAGRAAFRNLTSVQQQVQAANTANALASAVAVSEQRPWVRLDLVKLTGPIGPVQPGGKSFHVPLAIRVHNYGRTPATDLLWYARLIPMSPHVFATISQQVKSVIPRATHFGFMLFPNQTLKHIRTTVAFPHPPAPIDYQKDYLLVVAVTYGSIVAPQQQHQTVRSFFLNKVGGGIAYQGEPLAATDVTISQCPIRNTSWVT